MQKNSEDEKLISVSYDRWEEVDKMETPTVLKTLEEIPNLSSKNLFEIAANWQDYIQIIRNRVIVQKGRDKV